ETVELLEAAGARVTEFDPAREEMLPEGTRGLYLGGGFPEVHARTLATNRPLVEQVRAAVAEGLPTVAECAGMLYLTETLDDHAMVGALPARAAMGRRLTLGYREAVAATDSVLGPAGTAFTGHEFHRTQSTPGAGASAAWSLDGREEGFALDQAATGRAARGRRLTLGYREAVAATDTVLGPAGAAFTGHEFHRTQSTPGAGASAAWSLDGREEGFALDPAATGRATLVASYLHTHWAC